MTEGTVVSSSQWERRRFIERAGEMESNDILELMKYSLGKGHPWKEPLSESLYGRKANRAE